MKYTWNYYLRKIFSTFIAAKNCRITSQQPQMNLRPKKVVLGHIFLLIFVALSVFTAGISHWLWKDMRHDAFKELSYTSSVIKSYYELSFRQWELSLRAVGTHLVGITGDNAQERRQEFANSALKIHEQLLAFGFADTTGQVTVFTGAQPGDSLPHLTRSENTRRSFIQAKTGENLVIGEVYYFPNVRDWILPIRLPIRNEAGKLLAVNTSAIDYQRLTNDLKNFGLTDRFRVHLINKAFNTTQLYFPLHQDSYYEVLGKGADVYTDVTPLATLPSGEFMEATNTLESYDGIFMRAALDGLNHDLIVSMSNTSIRAAAWANLKLILFTYLGLSLIIGLLFLYFRSKQSQYMGEVEVERANLKALFESTTNIIGLYDTNQRLMEFNGAFAHYAKTIEGIDLKIGMDVMAEMKNQKMAETFRKFQRRALKGEKFQETIKYPAPKGHLYLSFSYNPIYQGKKITGLSMFVQDVTDLTETQLRLEEYNQTLEERVQERTSEMEQKNVDLEIALTSLQGTQRQLIQSEKMASLGALSAGLGHEINNPLNFIANGVKALMNALNKKYPDSKQELSPFVEIIDQGVQRASGIVKSLSHFSRHGDNLTEECEIHDILENCLVILHNKWRDRITIDRQYSANKIIVKGNEGKLHQALMNILSNAIQAIEGEGTITLTTGQKGKKAIISIQDDGSGMSDDLVARITDPFFTTRAPGEGVGLGLFITQAIIEEHKGKMEVFSHPNEGTEVLITI